MRKKFFGAILILAAALPLRCWSQARILIVDYLVSDPLVFMKFFKHFSAPEFDLEYRRFYPGLVKTDASFDVIVLAASRHPFPSAAKMTPAEARFLKEYILNGGILVSLYSSEDNDRLILNRLLKELAVPVRIEGKSLADPVNGYKSQLVPAAYYLDYPLLQVATDTPLGKGVDRIYGGKSFSLLAAPDPNVCIPVYSYETSLRMEGFNSPEKSGQKGTEGLYLGGSYEVAVMAVARAGKGVILLLPRYLINMNGYTTRWSDKPAIPAGFLKENDTFEDNLMEYIKALSRGEEVFKPAFPLARADRLDKWEDRSEQATLEEEEVPVVAPEGVNVDLIFNPKEKRQLRILHPALRNLAEEKIRSVFFHLDREFGRSDAVERIAAYLRQAGFNLIEGMLGVSPYEGLKTEQVKKTYLENLRSILTVMKSHNLRLYMGSYFPYGNYYKKKAYSRLVSSSGVESGMPSPVDRIYWREAFLPLALELARLSREFPETLIGMIWDLELYDFDTVALSEAYSFDNIAFDVFMARKKTVLDKLRLAPEARRVPQYLRFSWLKENGLLREYYQALEDEMGDIARWLDAEVKEVNPDFLWGFYAPGIVQSWFYTGLFKALSSPERPLLLISYEGRGMQQADYNAQHGVHFLHCPGLLLNTLKGEEWSLCVPALAAAEDGYWLYQGFQFFRDDTWRFGRNDFSFRESPADLRRHLKQANERLTELLK